MIKLLFIVALTFSSAAPKRTIQSTYTGFTKSCSAFSYFEKKKHLTEYIQSVEQFAQEIPEKDLNKKLDDNTDEVAQIKLFSPMAFYQPKRVVGAYVGCYSYMESFLESKEMKAGLFQLDSWKNCIKNIGSNSKELRIASDVKNCMKNPKK